MSKVEKLEEEYKEIRDLLNIASFETEKDDPEKITEYEDKLIDLEFKISEELKYEN